MRKQWGFFSKAGFPDVSDALVVKAYSDVTGYVPGDENTDQGTALTDALKAWLRVGFDSGIPEREQILGFCSINPTKPAELRYSVAWMGSAYIGIQMPVAWQDAQSWDAGDAEAYEPGSWGGHCVCVVGYDSSWVYVVSWGQVIRMSWPAWETYVDEAYCVLTTDWRSPPGVSPSGLSWDRLLSAMEALRHHQVIS